MQWKGNKIRGQGDIPSLPGAYDQSKQTHCTLRSLAPVARLCSNSLERLAVQNSHHCFCVSFPVRGLKTPTGVLTLAKKS